MEKCIFFDNLKKLKEEIFDQNQKHNFYVFDKNVLSLYNKIFFPIPTNSFVFECTENTKSIFSIEEIIKFLVENNAQRHSTIFAIGGGVCGDVVSFVASIYMRGVKFVNIPTTLLAQVDSAIGGKNGINFLNNKNLLGNFFKATKVLYCTEFLQTLDKMQLLSGFAEIIKMWTCDESILEGEASNLLEQCSNGLLFDKINKTILSRIIEKCIKFKQNLTDRDFLEKNLRKTLNFGHTIGHSLEKFDSFAFEHGFYVAFGMYIELKLFFEFVDKEFYDRFMNLLKTYYIDPYFARIRAIDIESIVKNCLLDKKNHDNFILFCIPNNFGLDNYNFFKLTEEELKRKLHEVFE